MKQRIARLHSSQSGIVSILVCLIMMIVITLVVLGFSQLSRNELNQTLNRQLSTEAFYAANSGINNATKIITADIAKGIALTSTTNCGTGSPYDDNAELDSTIVAYSCVNVNVSPSSLKYQIPSTSSVAFPATVAAGQTINSLTFKWNNPAAGSTYSSCPANQGSFSAATEWSTATAPCDAGVLQVDLVSAANSQTIALQETGSYSVFLSPTDSAVPATHRLANGAVYKAGCVAGGVCTATITGLNAQSYYVRIGSIYTANTVVITANTGLPLSGAQADVDVTGKAQDVLQRLDARITLSTLDNGATPSFAIQTGDSLCKEITGYVGGIATNGGSDDPGCAVPGATTPPQQQASPSSFTANIGNVECVTSCGVTSGPVLYGNIVTYNNQSLFPDGTTETSCTWNFGDGTPDITTGCTPATSNSSCILNVNCVEHEYAYAHSANGSPTGPVVNYKTVLTEYSATGSETATYTQAIPYTY